MRFTELGRASTETCCFGMGWLAEGNDLCLPDEGSEGTKIGVWVCAYGEGIA